MLSQAPLGVADPLGSRSRFRSQVLELVCKFIPLKAPLRERGWVKRDWNTPQNGWFSQSLATCDPVKEF